MNNQLLFTESQKFRQWWLMLMLLIANSFVIYGILNSVIIFHRSIIEINLIIVVCIMLLFNILLFSLRLDTMIKTDGIYVRYFPFQRKYKYFAWESISKSYVKKYSPILEYGGWGIRHGIFGNGKAYNVSGNIGLQLEFTNNKRLLIGTKKSEELIAVLTEIGKLNPHEK